MFRKTRKRPSRRTTRFRLGLEALEARLTPAIVFPHHFGDQSTFDEGGDKLDAAPVFLLFWGNYWDHGTGAQERSQIIDGIRKTLDGPYLSGLAQYGVDWHAHFVNAVQINQDPPPNFEYDDLKTVIQDTISFQTDDPALYFPRPSSVVGDPLYLAVTPPGVESGLANSAGYHTAALQFFSLTDIEAEAIGVAETGTVGGYTVVDQATKVLSHEIFEAITDPYSAYQDLGAILPFVDTTPGIRATPGAQWPSAAPGESEIGDFESVNYRHRLNGTLVQAYWSQQDNASIVADGNIQRFTLMPIWTGNNFTHKSRLTIQGDQFAAGYDDKVFITTVDVNGVENIRVTLNGETAFFEVDKLGAPSTPGDSRDAIVIQLGGGDNHVDLTGYKSALKIRVEQQAPPLITINDLVMAEGSANYLGVDIASIVTGGFGSVTETHPEVSVDYFAPASGGGTAAPTDFTVLPQRLTIPADDMSAGVYVVAAADTLMERDETFVVQLKNAVGGKIVDDTAIVTIIDDDLTPTFVTPTGPFDVNWHGDGHLVDSVPDSNPLRNFGTAVSGSAIDTNGRLVVLGGEVATGSDDNAIKLTRYLPNGERDLTFDTDGLVSLRLLNQSIYTTVSGIAIYQSGPNRDKILVVGKYDVAGTSNSFVARFGIDGTLDTTFGSGRGYIEVDYGTFPETTPYDHAFDVAIYESGPHAGEFVLVGANENGRASSTEVSRHHADGSLDGSFGNAGKLNLRLQYSDDHGGTDNTLMSRVLIDGNGKILLGGRAGVPGTYSGSYDTRTAAGALVRLNSNGSLDTSFGIQGAAFCNIEQGDGQGISDIALQADGKILATVAGDGYYFGGRLVRFNQNGVLDLTMAPVAPTGYSAGQTVLKSVNVGIDGTVYVGGYATPGGASGFGDFVVARYQPTGTTLVLDTGFDTTQRDGAITSSPSGVGVVSLVNAPDGGIFASGRGRDVQEKLAFATNKLETARSDISVTMTSSVAENGQVFYTIQVQNLGSDAVFASLRDTLPVNAKLLSAIAPEGWVTSPVGTTGSIEMTTRNLKQSDGIKTIILTVGFDGVGAPGSVVNRVEASSANLDPNSSNNLATTTDDLRQNLSIDVGTSRIDSVSAGTPVTFILDVSNQGPLASSYQVSTTLPLNSTFVSATGNYTLVGRTVTWTESPLGAGAHRSRLLNVIATSDGYLVDQATVTGQFADATPLDNTASNYTTPSLGFAPFSGLVSYYRAEDNTNDFTGAHPALNSTVIGYGTGHNGRGFVFNGTNTSVDLGSWFTGNGFQSFTMNLWVNPARIQQTYADIFDNNHPSNFVFQQDENNLNRYVWGVYDGNSGNPFATLSAGQWQLLTVTRDNATLKDRIYVNGNQVGEMTASGPISYSNAFLRLGRWGGGGRNWNGLMDDVSIFSRALTPSEIQQLVVADMGVANQPPTISSARPTLRVQQGQPAVMTGLVNDADGFDSRLLLTASIGTAVVSTSQTGHFEWTLDTTGLPVQTTSVTVTVNDGDGGVTTTSFDLEIIPAETGTLRAEIVGGDLQVTDISTDERDNNLTLDYGQTIVLSDAVEKFVSAPNGWTMSADHKSISIPAANFTHQIKIQGAGGNDHLDVVLHSGTSLGDLIDFNGGSPNIFYSDSLSLSGDPLGAANLHLDAGNQGTIELNGVGQIHFANVNQIGDDASATTIDVYLPLLGTTGASRPVLTDDGIAANGVSRLISEIDAFPTIDFVSSNQSFVVHSGGLSDRLRVQNAVDFRSSLSVGSQSVPFQSVEFSGGLSLGVDQSLTCFTYDAIRVNSQSHLEFHGAGQLNWQSERRIEVGIGGLISTESGGITMHAGLGPLLSVDAFSGISINTATIQSTSGDILLAGNGIGKGVAGVDLYSSVIKSNSGAINLIGTRQSSLVTDVLQLIHHDELGIGVSVGETLIKTGSAINVTGTADISEAPGSGELFQGVHISRSSRIDSQSDVTIEGTYNSTAVTVSPNLFGSRGDGVDNEGILSAKNSIFIHGTALSAGAESYGVIAGGEIQTINGQISITGNGGKAVGSRGVALAGFILGTGGVSITGSNQSNFALAAVGSIGSEWIVTASSGNVNITGNSDAAYDGFSLNDGVSLNNGTVAAQYDISVIGTVTGDGSAVHFGSAAFLLSAQGDITIEGTGGTRAVYLDENVTAPIELNSGHDLSITGRLSNDSPLVSDGVYIGSGSLIAQNSVVIDGTGIASTGVAVHGKIKANTGSLSITGRTPAMQSSTDSNAGVLIDSVLNAAGPIHITGTTEVFAGIGTTSTSQGVTITGSAQVISNDAITIEGTYTSIPVLGNEAYYVLEGDGVRNDGYVLAEGDITVAGTASFAGARSFGVVAGRFQSFNGQVSITGSGAEANFSSGVLVNGIIEGLTGVTITGSNQSRLPLAAVCWFGGGWIVASAAGSVQITGEAVASRFGGGVDLRDGTITARDNILMTGTSSGRPAGVKLGSAVSLTTTLGDITIDGTGGERAVYFDENVNSPILLKSGHDISITGRLAITSPLDSDGVYIGGLSNLTAQNSVVIDGTGIGSMGAAVLGNINANGGSLSITGRTPAGLALANDNLGVLVDSVLIASGPIHIEGTTEVLAGTATRSTSQGVSISSSAQIISNDAVTIDGTYTSIPVLGNEGYYILEGNGVRNDGYVLAEGDITVTGTASFAGARSFGVVAGRFQSFNGQVSITGSGAEADFSSGVLVNGIIEGLTGVTITGNNRSSFQFPAVGSLGGGWVVASAAGSVEITGEAVAARFGGGVDFTDGTITAHDNISITGTATSIPAGVTLGSAVSLTTTVGDITIKGTGGAQAVYVEAGSASNVNVMAGRNISLTGSRGATRMPGDGTVILSGTFLAQGNINLFGTGIGGHSVGINTSNSTFTAQGVVKLDGRNDFAADDDSAKTGAEGAAVKTGDVTFMSTGGPTELKGTSLDGLPAGGAISISGGVLRTSGRDLLLNPGLAGVRFPKKSLDVSTFDGNATYGTVSFSPGARFHTAINGRTPDTEFDRFVVDGKINLAGAQLTTSGDFSLFRSVSAASDNLQFVSNVSSQPTLGQFGNAPDSQALRLGSRLVKVAYGKSDNEVALQPVSFDFNVSTTQNEATYTSVLANALYSDATGFGWLNLPTAVVRSGPSGYRMLQDFHEGTDNTFRVKLPNGSYTITVTLGDNDLSRSASVKANGVLVLDKIATSKGQFVHRTFDVTVTDGKLDIQILGVNGKFALNAIGIDANPRANIVIKELGRSLDSNGNQVINFQGISDINSGTGGAITLTTSRGAINGVTDFSKEYAGIQVETGPGGVFNFSVLSSSIGSMMVTAEHAAGSRFGLYTTTLVAPSSRKLDFNVVGSPTATGSLGVLPTQTFNSANPVTPYGWKTWTTGLDDALNTNALRRDGHLGTDNTFSIQVDRSQPAYSVTVYLGDSRNLRDNVQVWVEGNLITAASGVTTAVGAFTSVSTTLASSGISADGILDIRFVDLGGLSTQFLVNGIDLNAVALPSAQTVASTLISKQAISNNASPLAQVAAPLMVTPSTQSQSTSSSQNSGLDASSVQVAQSVSLTNKIASAFDAVAIPLVITSKPVQAADELWAASDFLDELSSLVTELKVNKKLLTP